MLIDERKESAIAFLKAAVAYYASLSISVARVISDNAPATDPKPSPCAKDEAQAEYPVSTIKRKIRTSRPDDGEDHETLLVNCQLWRFASIHDPIANLFHFP